MLYRTPQIAPVSAFACYGGRLTLPFIRPPPISLSKSARAAVSIRLDARGMRTILSAGPNLNLRERS
jgi:hypothetical protein